MNHNIKRAGPIVSKGTAPQGVKPMQGVPQWASPPKVGVKANKQEPRRQLISLQVIADKLERLTFKTALFGYSKKDVWHKISRLDEMYRELYDLQEFRYQSLVRERDELLRRSRGGGQPRV